MTNRNERRRGEEMFNGVQRTVNNGNNNLIGFLKYFSDIDTNDPCSCLSQAFRDFMIKP